MDGRVAEYRRQIIGETLCRVGYGSVGDLEMSSDRGSSSFVDVLSPDGLIHFQREVASKTNSSFDAHGTSKPRRQLGLSILTPDCRQIPRL